jgi:ribosomal-protein-alanine N-acetyltransferase
MSAMVRRLGRGDEPVLALLARDDADFDLEGRGAPREPLPSDASAQFLADPGVRAWVAEENGSVVGFLYGHVIRKRASPAVEVLLYEIGVRAAHRRRGVGRALVKALLAWADDLGARETWVLAGNPGATAFYHACGFEPSDEPTVMLSHRRRARMV